MDTVLQGNQKIRNMTEDDLPQLAQWAADAFTSKETGLTWTQETMLAHLSHDFKGEHSFVMYDKTGLVGGIMAYPCKYDRGNELFLHTIVIRPDQQSQGVGKALLGWFIKYAKNQHITGIRLDAHVRLPSYAWYKQFGFQPSGWEQELLTLT
ncbi:hypothetical protein A2Z00_01345 [Candidatus Gottesmanbacteria bacterium RBG_13_45_10]|uniref:N-acetyltransferase domain-containing protein n=1 Tax=Candidatus Gottesmanbacteria bacterium RBG_13_45_10 TaxID=1798370 RepID=A0A1F5ZH20_9BACT|nr:MAG: hypothetical protein A2Z00_01345 [Candidatus Gottesmanbacteria bacterium RBG_13_45_10]